MSTQTKEMYSEVYSILNMLGEKYIAKIPRTLMSIIEEEKNPEYNPIYDANIKLSEQNIKRETISMIALFHLNYWCDTEEEKTELKKLFKNNEITYQKELREKYNPDKIFEKQKEETKTTVESKAELHENKEIAITKKENIIRKLINKIKNIFRKN